MSLENQLMEDMKIAMKAKDKVRLETVRGLRGQIKNAQINKGETLTDEEILQVLGSAAKKRRDSISQFKDVGRDDRAAEEAVELKIIESYLPAQLDATAIAEVVVAAIASVNATSMQDMGKVMGASMPKLKGKADGKLVQQIVKEKLSSL